VRKASFIICMQIGQRKSFSNSASSALGAEEGSGDATAAAVDVEGFGSGFTAGTMAPVETSSIYKKKELIFVGCFGLPV